MTNYAEMSRDELIRRVNDLEQEQGRLQEELNHRAAQDRHVMRSSELEWRNIGEKMAVDGQRLPIRLAHAVHPALGFNVHNLDVFFVEVPPGTQPGAYHMHGEAVKYYLQGRATEIIGDKQYQVKAGDIVFIPAFTWHGTQNIGDEPLRFLAATQGVSATQIKPVFKSREDLRVK